MRVAIIAAVAANNVIGRDNRMPWHLSADLRRFKRLTMGHHLIMGRKTFESIGRPLPGRTTIVLSRCLAAAPEGVELARGLDEALQMAECRSETEVFVAGGAEVYPQAIEHADRLYLTRIHAEFTGDAFFPKLDLEQWLCVEQEDHGPGEDGAPAHSFVVLDRQRDDRSAGVDRTDRQQAAMPGQTGASALR